MVLGSRTWSVALLCAPMVSLYLLRLHPNFFPISSFPVCTIIAVKSNHCYMLSSLWCYLLYVFIQIISQSLPSPSEQSSPQRVIESTSKIHNNNRWCANIPPVPPHVDPCSSLPPLHPVQKSTWHTATKSTDIQWRRARTNRRVLILFLERLRPIRQYRTWDRSLRVDTVWRWIFPKSQSKKWRKSDSSLGTCLPWENVCVKKKKGMWDVCMNEEMLEDDDCDRPLQCTTTYQAAAPANKWCKTNSIPSFQYSVSYKFLTWYTTKKVISRCAPGWYLNIRSSIPDSCMLSSNDKDDDVVFLLPMESKKWWIISEQTCRFDIAM